MTEAEKANAVAAGMGEGISVTWVDFLAACEERQISFVKGKTILQMKEDFLKSLDAVVPDSQEESDLSQLVVDIQIALVDGAPIVGSPEDPPSKKEKKTKVKKVKAAAKEKAPKVPKEPKPKKEKVPRALKPKLGGIGMKPMCRDLFGEMTKEQVDLAKVEIKNKLAKVYVDKGKTLEYGLVRAERILCDIHAEKFGKREKDPKVPKPKKEEPAVETAAAEEPAVETAAE